MFVRFVLSEIHPHGVSFTTLRECPSGAICATCDLGASPTDFGAPVNSSPSTCPSSVSITVPAGERVDSVSVFYSMTSVGFAYMSEQRSWLECVETSQTEAAASSGAGSSLARLPIEQVLPSAPMRRVR